MFLLSRTTCRSEPECEGEADATATRRAGGCWATRCPSPGTGWPSWPSQPSCHPLARAPRVLEGPDLHRPSSNVRSLLGDSVSVVEERGLPPPGAGWTGALRIADGTASHPGPLCRGRAPSFTQTPACKEHGGLCPCTAPASVEPNFLHPGSAWLQRRVGEQSFRKGQ